MTNSTSSAPVLHLGAVLYFVNDPARVGDEAVCYHPRGALWVETGKIVAVGEAGELSARFPPHGDVIDHGTKLLMPGFIDTHIHYPQAEVMGSHGEQLLDWLNNYTFPAERQYQDADYAESMAEFFLDQLLAAGTTTAVVFGTVHPESINAFFSASERRNTRMIAGKVLMDRNAPDYLQDTPESGYADSKALIERWHGKGRQLYAVTPRFAITSTAEQMALAGKLLQEYPNLYVQSHISENRDEVQAVSDLYPDCIDYLDVYDRFGLLSERTVLAHGIHLTPREHQRLRETGTSIAFCPTSNLFLGSGLLDLETLDAASVRYSIATDVGGGTSFSMLQTLHEAYKVAQLQHHSLCPLHSLYMATLGNARSIGLDDRIGSFRPGNEADFVVIDTRATPLMKMRMGKTRTLDEQLFALIVLGDDRAIAATYIAGSLTHERAAGPVTNGELR